MTVFAGWPGPGDLSIIVVAAAGQAKGDVVYQLLCPLPSFLTLTSQHLVAIGSQAGVWNDQLPLRLPDPIPVHQEDWPNPRGSLPASYLAAINAQAAVWQDRLALQLPGTYLAVRNDAVLGQSTGTVYLTAAATVGAGGVIVVKNAGVGTITIDANGAETIDGALTKSLAGGASVALITDGASWFSF